MNITNSLFHYKGKKMLPLVKDYAKYSIGATALATIDAALRYAKSGFDGIIHVKSFGCTPETDAIPALQNISADYKIPILYLSSVSYTHLGFLYRIRNQHGIRLYSGQHGAVGTL